MKNILTLLLFIEAILVFTSCAKKPTTKQILKKEHLIYNEFLDTVNHIFAEKGNDYIYSYLDSINNEDHDKLLSIYSELIHFRYKIKYNFEKNHDSILQLEGSSTFNEGSPFTKYLILKTLKHYFLKAKNYKKALDLEIEAVAYVEPFPEIYHLELAHLYSNIANYSKHYFNETDKSKKSRKKALEFAIKYHHDELASKILFNQNIETISNGDFENALNSVNKIIELNEDEFNPESMHLAYLQLRECYVKMTLCDSVDRIDKKYRQLYEENKFTQDQYANYLLFAVDNDLEQIWTDNLTHKFEYLHSYFLQKNQQGNPAGAYLLHVFYKNKSKYASFNHNIDEQIKFTLLSLEYFHKVTHLPDDYYINMKEDLEDLEMIYLQNKSFSQGLELAQQIRTIDSSRHVLLENELDVFKKQLDYWSEKDIKHANEQIDVQNTKIRLWSFLFGLVVIFTITLIYLIIEINNSRKKISSQKIELETVINAVPIGLCKIDMDLNVLWANETIKGFYKIDNKSMLEGNYVNIIHPSLEEEIKNMISRIENSNIIEVERAMTKDFRIAPSFEEGLKWIKTILIPFKNYKGNIESFILLNDDHTAEKLTEFELWRQKKSLEDLNLELIGKSKTISKQNQKLEDTINTLEESNESLFRFAAIAAHDLKAPLRTITSFTKIIYRKYSDIIAKKDKELFNYVIKDTGSLKKMIEGLLEYSKISNDNTNLVKINLLDSIKKVLDSLKVIIDEEDVTINLPVDSLIVMGHLTLIDQVFLNLINNAIKFRNKDVSPVINISFRQDPNNFVIISIADNGIGIDKKHHGEIFKIFKQLHSKSEYDGNGIGLSTCKKIVESFGGEMWLESTKGKGTTLFFTLQAATNTTKVLVPLKEFSC